MPEPIDHAFVMVPAPMSKASSRQCVARGDSGGHHLQRRFRRDRARRRPRAAADRRHRARPAASRLIGPNCIGLIVPPQPLRAVGQRGARNAANHARRAWRLVSQSGSMMGGILSRGLGRGVGFSAADFGRQRSRPRRRRTRRPAGRRPAHRRDPAVHGNDPRRAAPRACRRRAARRRQAGDRLQARPLRSRAGPRRLAHRRDGRHRRSRSTRGSMRTACCASTSSKRCSKCRRCCGQGRRPAARRVAVMTTTGGGAAMVVDRLGTAASMSSARRRRWSRNLRRKNITHRQRPGDRPDAGRREKEIYAAVLDALLASDHCDLVLAVAGSSAQFQPQIAVEPMVEADRRGKRAAGVPAPQADASLALLARAGVAGFRTPEACADAIRALARWREPQPDGVPEGDGNRRGGGRIRTGRALRGRNVRRSAGAFGVRGARRTAGRLARHRRCRRSRPVAAARGRQGAVARHPAQVRHRRRAPPLRDRGRCAQGRSPICWPRRAAPRRRRASAARWCSGWKRGSREVILGFRRDPQTGPTIIVGAGGTLAEIYRDVVVRPAPVSLEEARADGRRGARTRAIARLPGRHLRRHRGVVPRCAALLAACMRRRCGRRRGRDQSAAGARGRCRRRCARRGAGHRTGGSMSSTVRREPRPAAKVSSVAPAGATTRLAVLAAGAFPAGHLAATRNAARRHLMDTTGAIVAGMRQPLTQRTLVVHRALIAAGPVNVPGDALGWDALTAAYLMGTAAHGLELDDGYTQGSVHPGVTVVPALLAAAQLRRVSGAQLLTRGCGRLRTGSAARTRCAPGVAAARLPQHRHRRAGGGGRSGRARSTASTPRRSSTRWGSPPAAHRGCSHSCTRVATPSDCTRATLRAKDFSAALLAEGGMRGPTGVLESRDGFVQAFGDPARSPPAATGGRRRTGGHHAVLHQAVGMLPAHPSGTRRPVRHRPRDGPACRGRRAHRRGHLRYRGDARRTPAGRTCSRRR